jgi:hypothetical protein
MLKIDGYEVDAEVRGEPVLESEVTPYPVDKQASRADHVITKPTKLTIEGVVTNSPLHGMAASRSQFTLVDGEAYARPADEARARLVAIRNNKEPVTVESATGRWENMVLVSLSFPRDRSTGRALRFTAVFEELIITEVERVSVRVSMPRAKDKVDRGFRSAVDAVTGVTSLLNPFREGSELVVPATNNTTEIANRLNHTRVANRRPALLRGSDPTVDPIDLDELALLK